MYGWYFDKPPLSSHARVSVGGKDIPVASTWLDRDLLRIEITLDSMAQYRELFNPSLYDFTRRRLVIETDGPIPRIVRSYPFEPEARITDCL
jgi:hypothetical protein